MFILKSFEYIIKDCDSIYQKVHFDIMNNGYIVAQMFEGDEYKTTLPIDILIDKNTFEDCLYFDVIEPLDDEETTEKVNAMIDEVFNEHRKLFANYNFSRERVNQFYNGIMNKNNREVEEFLYESKVKEAKEKQVRKIINDCLR